MIIDGNYYSINFNKKFGQNFITDKNLLAAIAADAGVTNQDTVVEIGAGAFAYDDAVTEVNIVNNGYFFMEGAVLFSDGGRTLHTVFDGMLDTYYY